MNTEILEYESGKLDTASGTDNRTMVTNRNNSDPDVSADNNTTIETYIKNEADKCVKCALCLPHCPTYLHTFNEGESPRGRIALIQGMVERQLEVSPALVAHLDHCLTCRSCERVCPSGVHFGNLINAARNLINQETRQKKIRKKSTAWLQKILLGPLTLSSEKISLLKSWLLFYQRSGLRWLTVHSGMVKLLGLSRFEQALPTVKSYPPPKNEYPSIGQERGKVALFRGCLATALDKETLQASIKVLTHYGYRVHVPQNQACCGAMHLHHGQMQQTRELAQQNIEAFNLDVDAVIYTASGCGATLIEYQELFSSLNPVTKFQGFNKPVMEISEFLANQSLPETLHFKPLNKTIALHTPCTLNNVIRKPDSPIRLLEKIPGAIITPMVTDEKCCGAAGSFFIEQPEIAKTLRDAQLQAVKNIDPDVIATSNFGCGMHMRSGLSKSGKKIRIVHPAVLMARQIVMGDG